MSEFTATPDQWAYQEHWAAEDGDAACLLELRSRIEALEANAKPMSDPAQSPSLDWITREQLDQVAELLRPAPIKPDSSLVERVRKVIALENDPMDWFYDESRAAIQEVAAWLRENSGGTRAAWMLEQEVER